MVMLKKGEISALGTPETVLTEKNIEDVYGIKANVSTSVVGKPQVTPIVHDLDQLTAKLSPLIAVNN
jgi:iron complex transport system ATP-binding protein